MPLFEHLYVNLIHHHQQEQCVALPNWEHPSIYSSPPMFCAMNMAIPSSYFSISKELFTSTHKSISNSPSLQIVLENFHHSFTYLATVYIDDRQWFFNQSVVRPGQRQFLKDVVLNIKYWEQNKGLIQVTWQQVIQVGSQQRPPSLM
ncbi:hypothetical protein HMI54_012572, partial [Coelomomyces lativittatus]